MVEIVPSRTASSRDFRSSAARSGGFIFRFGSSERDRLVGQDEVVRRRLAGRLHARRERLPQLVDRLARGQVEQVNRLPLVRGEREVAADHHALGHRRVTGEAELGRDRALVHLAAAGERRLLAVDGDPPSGDRVVLKRAPHQPGATTGPAVVREPGRAGVGELGHLGELLAQLALRDRGEEPDGNLGLLSGRLDQRAEHGGRVDDRLGVRHREDRAVAAGGGGSRAARDRLLVLAAGSAQVDVRVDERGREHETAPLDDTVAVRVHVQADLGDHAPVHADVQQLVDSQRRVDHAGAADDEVVLAALAEQHHATSSATWATTSTGPRVSRS